MHVRYCICGALFIIILIYAMYMTEQLTYVCCAHRATFPEYTGFMGVQKTKT